jgi:hypothetical protein
MLGMNESANRMAFPDDHSARSLEMAAFVEG